AEATSDNHETGQPCSGNGDSVLLDISENEVLPADGNNTVTNESKSCEGNQSDANSLNPFPTDLALANVELLENQQPDIQSRLSDPEKVTAPESALNSCTVVEGLLFPVEYYVRTTRRMSNCQRKVDLDAVILSQLGRSKKAQRSRCKQKDANSDRPSQERVKNDSESEVMPFPFLGAENDPANSSSPQKSLPASSGSSTSLGSVSQTSVTGAKPDRRRLQRKQKRGRKSACKPSVQQVSQELIDSLDLILPGDSSSLLSDECQSEKEHCQADLEKSSSEERSKRERSNPTGSEDPDFLGLPPMDPDTCSPLFSFRSLRWLVPKLGIRDFNLPDEEFGLLKLEKLESSPVNDLEVFVPSVFGCDGAASEGTQDVEMNSEEKGLKSNLISPVKNGSPKLPHGESPASKKELSTHALFFTPTGTVLGRAPTQPESPNSSYVFPVVGATPAVLPSVCSEVFPNTPSEAPLQASLHPSKGASTQVVDDGECKDSAVPLHSDSCGAGSARKEEEKSIELHLEAERVLHDKSDETVALEKYQQSESKQQRSCRDFPEQGKDEAEQFTPVLLDSLREESLQLVSKLKDCSSSCAVDVSTMWWDTAGCRELYVVTACENSVSLWKPLASDQWGKVYTWQVGEIPVIQIVPLPDTSNLVCVALGDLEIGEIRWLLLCSSENDSFKQSPVKTGNIKAVLGLKDRRLVSSSRTTQEQQVEIVSLSETGRSKDGQTLMSPEETVLAFAEVEGMRDALIGTTAVNGIVVWSVNLKTGQLLKKMHIGYSYPASICHRAYSDSGLLFVVLSHPHAKESESCGNPAFRVVAFNPKTARSAGVMFSSLPPGHTGRQGDVKDASAAAVLTSGAIAVWDLLLGQCTALLPPDPEGSWALARWATTSACLLAGQRDGTVCLYRYHQPQPGAA
ncbi:PALB2 protein, partial [Thinocorus orbignyianus]|nr:PALB2 protein [Thinocorus orbignyianus]